LVLAQKVKEMATNSKKNRKRLLFGSFFKILSISLFCVDILKHLHLATLGFWC